MKIYLDFSPFRAPNAQIVCTFVEENDTNCAGPTVGLCGTARTMHGFFASAAPPPRFRRHCRTAAEPSLPPSPSFSEIKLNLKIWSCSTAQISYELNFTPQSSPPQLDFIALIWSHGHDLLRFFTTWGMAVMSTCKMGVALMWCATIFICSLIPICILYGPCSFSWRLPMEYRRLEPHPDITHVITRVLKMKA